MIIELHINQSLLQITVYCSVYKYNQIKYRPKNRVPIKLLVRKCGSCTNWRAVQWACSHNFVSLSALLSLVLIVLILFGSLQFCI